MCVGVNNYYLKGVKHKNMNTKKIIVGIAALVVLAAVIVPQDSLAYRGDPKVKGSNYSEERHTIMTQAFENNDYQAWKNAMQGRGRVLEVINENNFAQFAKAHKLALEGKTQEANAIRTQLKLGQGQRMGRWAK